MKSNTLTIIETSERKEEKAKIAITLEREDKTTFLLYADDYSDVNTLEKALR